MLKKKESKQKYLILDCETGGLNPLENPITEIAMIAVDKDTFREVNRWETFVRPYADLKLTKEALRGTGITMEQINNGKQLKNFVEMMIKFMDSISPKNDRGGRNNPLIVGHNVGFDIRFIRTAFSFVDKDLYDYVDASVEAIDKLYNPVKNAREGDINRIDTLTLSRELWNDGGRHRLSDCCQRIGYEHIDSHRAMPDVIATKALLEYLITRKLRGKIVEEEKKKGVKKTEIELPKHRLHFQF